jgi:hypothetical protein
MVTASTLWPRSLTVPLAYQVAAFDLLVPPDCRLPKGWKISVGGHAIPPLPVGADLENIIHRCCNKLLEEDRNDPNFAADSDFLLADERLAALEAFEGPVRPALYNKADCHAWWNGRSFWEVTAALRVGLQVQAPRDFSTPRASSVLTRTTSSSSSRSATSCRPSCVSVSFRATATPEVKVKREVAPEVKVEVK